MTGMLAFDIIPVQRHAGLAVYTLASLFISLIFNVVILSTANSAVSSVDSIAQESKRKIDRITGYLRFQGVEYALRQKITEFYKHMLAASQTVDDHKMTKELPPQLSAMLAIEVNRPLIANCPLFHVLDNASILSLLSCLQASTMAPEQTITREGQISGAMYFIIRGMVRSMRTVPTTQVRRPHSTPTARPS